MIGGLGERPRCIVRGRGRPRVGSGPCWLARYRPSPPHLGAGPPQGRTGQPSHRPGRRSRGDRGCGNRLAGGGALSRPGRLGSAGHCWEGPRVAPKMWPVSRQWPGGPRCCATPWPARRGWNRPSSPPPRWRRWRSGPRSLPSRSASKASGLYRRFGPSPTKWPTRPVTSSLPL